MAPECQITGARVADAAPLYSAKAFGQRAAFGLQDLELRDHGDGLVAKRVSLVAVGERLALSERTAILGAKYDHAAAARVFDFVSD